MSFYKIRLELARSHDFPEGSNERGYEFVAPLDDEAHIHAAEWRANRDRCKVMRFWKDEDSEMGHLIHKPGGSWAFHYDIHGDEQDDESGYRFQTHAFKLGEYVSVREHDESLQTFVVVSVDKLDA